MKRDEVLQLKDTVSDLQSSEKVSSPSSSAFESESLSVMREKVHRVIVFLFPLDKIQVQRLELELRGVPGGNTSIEIESLQVSVWFYSDIILSLNLTQADLDRAHLLRKERFDLSSMFIFILKSDYREEELLVAKRTISDLTNDLRKNGVF